MSGSNPTDPAGQDAPTEVERPTGLFGRRQLRSPKEALQPEDAPPPPQVSPSSRRRPALSAFSGFLSFLLIAAVGTIALFAYAQQQIAAPGPLQADKVVLIAPRTEVHEIIAQLESEGVIENSLLLNVTLVAEGNRSKIKAGEYLFKQQASLRDVIDTLVNGREILHSITIPEGLTSEQIVQRLRDNDLLTGDLRDIPKEGTLLPETYRVARGMARADLVRKMQDDEKKVLEQIWTRRSSDIPLRSPGELVTLASIVEKETGRADERPRVAGVFLNRLAKRMRLQSDPTIVYGLVGGKGTLGRGILRSEVDRPTPYNTYQIEGLPPGPIANPGRAALEAVANPSRTKDLFFVADGTGGHVFAETLDQHARNVTRWRQIEKDMKAQPNAAPTVDRVQPDAAPVAPSGPAGVLAPGARDQRGELLPAGDSTFGGPPARFAATPAGVLGYAALAAAAPASAPAAAQAPAQQAQAQPARVTTPAAGAAVAPLAAPPAAPPAAPSAAAPIATSADPGAALGLGKLNQALEASFPTPHSAIDGPIDDPDGDVTDPNAYPLSAKRRAEQRERAARYGVAAGSDDLPPEPAARTAEPAAPRVVRIYDASEGTRLDPLKDKSWDLNSPKIVPDIKPEDPPKPVKARPAAVAPQPGSAPPVKLAAQPQPAPKPSAKPASKPKPARPKPAPAPAADSDEADPAE